MNVIETWLFIGGIADGERRPLTGPMWQALVHEKADMPLTPSHDERGLRGIKTMLYYRTYMQGDEGQRFAFYRHENMSVGDALANLFAAYPAGRGRCVAS